MAIAGLDAVSIRSLFEEHELGPWKFAIIHPWINSSTSKSIFIGGSMMASCRLVPLSRPSVRTIPLKLLIVGGRNHSPELEKAKR
jgi:hypothetical protein